MDRRTPPEDVRHVGPMSVHTSAVLQIQDLDLDLDLANTGNVSPSSVILCPHDNQTHVPLVNVTQDSKTQ